MKKETKILISSMFINTFLILIKIIFGFICKSKTLIADGIHSFTDLTTDIVAVIGNILAKKPADDSHPYGHGQIEYLTSIIMGVVIICLGTTLLITGFNTKPDNPSLTIVYVSIVTIIIKYTFSAYMLRVGKKNKNNILIASGVESRADALTSIIVIISYLLTKLTKYNSIFKYSDNVCTLLIGVYIIIVGIKILKENILCIIGKKEEDKELLDKINNIILKDKQILNIKDLTLLKYGPYYLATVTIIIESNLNVKDTGKIILDLRKRVCNKRTKISYLQIEIKPSEE